MQKNTKKFQDQYDRLNPEQKDAVDTIDGPVLVLAGPGTGKTQILTMRIANILLNTDTDPSSILALTFTDSGVRAMKERLISIIGETAYKVNIYTFHSFSSDIIQTYPDYFISRGMSEPLSDLERIHVFKSIFDRLNLKDLKPFGSPYFYMETVISKIKELKREGVSPIAFRNTASMQTETKEFRQYDINKNLELSEIYEEYSKSLIELKRYDFEDMINFVVDEFQNNSEFLSTIQERYQYILVDEFQDTNSAQSNLLFHLTSFWGQNANIFVVGDDDQSIYRFQGASTENIKDFIEKYPNSKVINLTNNYRSEQYILDAALSLIDHNEIRINKFLNISKNLNSQVSEDPSNTIPFMEFSSSYVESFYITNAIKKLISEDKVKPNDIAVIYRNNADAQLLSEMLSKLGIKYQIQGGQNILENGLIIRFLHLLRVVYKIRSKDEDLDLFTLLNYEFLGFYPLDVLKVARFSTDKKINLFEALDSKELVGLNLNDQSKFSNLKTKLIEWNYDSVNLTFVEFIHKLIVESRFLVWVLNQTDNYRLLNILNSFIAEIKKLNSTDKELDLESFLNHIEIMNQYHIYINEEELELDDDAVHLLTAHKSKGLEYEYVFIPYFIDGKWSNVRSRDLIKFPKKLIDEVLEKSQITKLDQAEDERRLLYVAMTRAKKFINLSSSKTYMTAQNKKETVPSMYLTEISDKILTKVPTDSFEFQNSDILKLLMKIPEGTLIPTEEEVNFLKNSLRNFKLSATALNTYLECNYKFKLDILFKTPRPKEKQLILGSAIHAALKDTFTDSMKGNGFSLPRSIDYFKRNLDKEIIKKSEYQEIYDQGVFILSRYLEKYKVEYELLKGKILFLEKSFGFGFDVPIFENEIFLQGKIDKIELSGGDHRNIKIVDYKTGKPKTKNEILGHTKNSDGNLYRQLLFYKLLLEINNKQKYQVTDMMLDFIGDRKTEPVRVNIDGSDSDSEEKLKTDIRMVWSGIHNFRYERTTEYKNCYNCKYRYHCWPDKIPEADT